MWRLTYKWAQFTHPNKPTSWVIPRYFDRFNKTRRDRWVFGDRQSGAYLQKFAWTRIVRHAMVKSGASPDDPALAEYWAKRRRKPPPLSIDKANLRLFESQPGEAEPRLIHTRCRERHHAQRDRPKQPPAQQPPGLARAGCRETGTSGCMSRERLC
jgi:RNA-directed DNA polymerase